jgi:hypothetical protein
MKGPYQDAFRVESKPFMLLGALEGIRGKEQESKGPQIVPWSHHPAARVKSPSSAFSSTVLVMSFRKIIKIWLC